MYEKTRIDCHTHIVSQTIKDEYFSRTNAVAIVMQFPESIFDNSDCVNTVMSDERLVLSPCVDIKRPVAPQLEEIGQNLDRWKVVGLKIYLSYQRGRANDAKMNEIYAFAAANGLAVTFHTGICSLVLPSDGDISGSDIEYIADAAESYPSVSFIAAHMDDPRFDECMKAVSEHSNLYTDFSGAYETGTKEAEDVDGAAGRFREAIKAYPGTERRVLYGTDFCPPISLDQISEYDYTIERIFSPADFDGVYRENCLKAFPRLGKYARECGI